MVPARETSPLARPARPAFPRPRAWHVLGLVAAGVAFYAVMEFRWSLEDPGYGLIRQLRSSDDAEREAAARGLGQLKPRERRAIEPLTGALFDTDAHLRRHAADALAWIVRAGDPEAVMVKASLLAAIHDHDRDARLAIAAALAGLGAKPSSVVPTLIGLAGSDHAATRGEAVHLLGPFAREGAEARAVLLRAALGDVDPEVRWKAVAALGSSLLSPSPASEPLRRTVAGVLLGAADDEEPVVRTQAVLALGRLGAERGEVFPRLLKALDDPAPDVRYIAANWLGSSRTPAGRIATLLPVLDRTLSDPDPRVRHAIASALASHRYGFEGEDALPSLRASAEDPDREVRAALAQAILAIEQDVRDFRSRDLPGVVAELGDADAGVRARAAARLGEFGPKAAEAAPALARCLGDADGDVRQASARALGRLGPGGAAAAPALAALARSDPEERVRRAAGLSHSALLEGGGPGRSP